MTNPIEPEEREEFPLLIVDDEQEIVDMLRRSLTLEGFEVQTETDPQKAFERIQDENFKIVICDIRMPGMSGVDLLKNIKQVDGTVQVIMITGYVKIRYLVSSLSRGANDCIFKPIDIEQLKRSLDQSIRKLKRWEEVLGKVHSLESSTEERANVDT